MVGNEFVEDRVSGRHLEQPLITPQVVGKAIRYGFTLGEPFLRQPKRWATTAICRHGKPTRTSAVRSLTSERSSRHRPAHPRDCRRVAARLPDVGRHERRARRRNWLVKHQVPNLGFPVPACAWASAAMARTSTGFMKSSNAGFASLMVSNVEGIGLERRGVEPADHTRIVAGQSIIF